MWFAAVYFSYFFYDDKLQITECKCLKTLRTRIVCENCFNSVFKLVQVKMILEPPRDKTNKVAVRPAKTQISLGIHPV